jgi:hypothetical protein
MPHLTPDSDVRSIAMVMAGDNPGAMAGIMHLKGELDQLAWRFAMLQLDKIDVRGRRFYGLLNDVCDNDTQKWLSVTDALADEKLTAVDILAATDDWRPKTYEQLMEGKP